MDNSLTVVNCCTELGSFSSSFSSIFFRYLIGFDGLSEF